MRYTGRGYAVLPVVDIRSLGLLCHAVSHQYRVTKLNSPHRARDACPSPATGETAITTHSRLGRCGWSTTEYKTLVRSRSLDRTSPVTY
eukprot:scaffold60970_cov75-Phaeocystis_antarctica.AAC.1